MTVAIMQTTVRRRLLAGMVLWLVASTASARADRTEAAKLFEQARALIKAGKIDEACPVFERSFALERAVGTELNLADCHERLGHLAEAWRMFDDVATQSERAGNTVRQGVARDRANALLPKIGTIVVEIAEPSAPGIEVVVGGVPLSAATQVERKVDPGRIAVVARVPDHAPFSVEVQVDATKTIVVKVPAFVAAVAPPTITSKPPQRVRSHRSLLLPIATGSAAVAAWVIGGVVGLEARSLDRDQFSNGNCHRTPTYSTVCNANGAHEVERAGRDADIATGFAIAGAVLAAGAAVLYFTAPSELVVAPTATTSSAGLSIRGAF
jgi:hypothetical protein